MKNVVCYGTGVIGSGWGVVFLKNRCKVTFYDIDNARLEDARKKVNATIQFFCERQLIEKVDADKMLKNAVYTTNIEEALSDSEWIQENCPEKVSVKQSVIAEMEQYCSDTAIIASSTSGLLITDIADRARHPERIIGAHPYNPVYMMPLVEITKGEYTQQLYVDAAKEFYKELGKEPVVLNKECPGFLCNRIQAAVFREAFDLVNRGVCSVEDIDKAVTYSVGLRWAIIGPHLVAQLGGGTGGFTGIFTNMGPALEGWLKDMATWTEIPKGYIGLAQAGIREEMANRAEGTGQKGKELGEYLDNGIIELLKYHGKI